MFKKRKRTVRVSFVISKETKTLLDKLALVYEGNNTDVIEVLIDKAGKEYKITENLD